MRGQREEALTDLTTTIRLDENYLNAYWVLGNRYYALGRYDEALSSYQRYIDLADTNADESILVRVRELKRQQPPA
jgi:tetratricopeptide (TPR) repeat protein